jgi:hypothetical protein
MGIRHDLILAGHNQQIPTLDIGPPPLRRSNRLVVVIPAAVIWKEMLGTDIRRDSGNAVLELVSLHRSPGAIVADPWAQQERTAQGPGCDGSRPLGVESREIRMRMRVRHMREDPQNEVPAGRVAPDHDVFQRLAFALD